MAPDIATKHNYCHLKQGKISKKQIQKAEEIVSEPLLVYNNKIRMCRNPAGVNATNLQSINQF